MTGPAAKARMMAIIVGHVDSVITVTVARAVDLPVLGVWPQPDPRKESIHGERAPSAVHRIGK